MKTVADISAYDRQSRQLDLELALAEIAEVVTHHTDLDRLGYSSPTLLTTKIGSATVAVVDGTQNSGRSFKAISMANFPSSIELPVIASAGNAAIGLADATAREGKRVAVFAPRTILPSKRDALLARDNVFLDITAGTFEEAVAMARRHYHDIEGARAVSGSGVTAIAALKMTIAQDVVQAASEMWDRTDTEQVTVALQLGAGSLATACCLAIKDAIDEGALNPATAVILATPVRHDKAAFDGLNVNRTGPHASAITSSTSYVGRHVTIDLSDAARARAVAADLLPGYLPFGFEPTGLSGLAAVISDQKRMSSLGSSYVCVLSGANGCPEINQELDAALPFERLLN